MIVEDERVLELHFYEESSNEHCFAISSSVFLQNARHGIPADRSYRPPHSLTLIF